MRRLLRLATAPYRFLGNLALDCLLGPAEPFDSVFEAPRETPTEYPKGDCR